jgi:1-acyl-sn-glycerol-3-phosphate acyltransferase
LISKGESAAKMADTKIDKDVKFNIPNRPMVEFMRIFIWSYFRFVHCTYANGAKNVPLKGPVILAPNHQTYYDPPLVAAFTKRLLAYMAADYLFKVPIFNWLISLYGAFPVKKGSKRSAYKTAKAILEQGGAFVMFPEGTRTLDGKPLTVQDGVARLALQTGATIVPVSIFGGYEVWPKHIKRPRFFRPLRLIYHKPIVCEVTTDRQEMRERMGEIGAQLQRIYDRGYRHRKLLIRNSE